MLFGCPLEFEVFPILAFSAPGPPLPDLEEIDAGGPWVVGEWDSSDNRFTGSFTWLNCIQPVGFLNLLTFFGMFSLLHRFFYTQTRGVPNRTSSRANHAYHGQWPDTWDPNPGMASWKSLLSLAVAIGSTLIILVELFGKIRIIIVHIPVFVV